MRRFLLVLSLIAAGLAAPTAQTRPALSSTDIGDIAALLKLEDTRQFDEAELTRVLASKHAEVRRRAAVSIGRINDKRGSALLEKARADANLGVQAAVVFATGQLKDAATIEWLTGRLSAASASISREAARALGKFKALEPTPANPTGGDAAAARAARSALAAYLAKAPATAAAAPTVAEALLSFGRFAEKGVDLAPVIRWTTSPNLEVRWCATWALFRPRDPAAFPHLLKLVDDPSAEVRYWAVRGLTPAAVDAAGLNRNEAEARLRKMFQGDADRRVRTEALRALLLYDDETAFGALVNALYSPDSWISVSAAEAAGRFGKRAQALVPLLADVAEPKDPLSMQITVMPVLVSLASDAKPTIDLATRLTTSEVTAARNAGLRALGQLGEWGRARYTDIVTDPALAKRLPSVDEFVARYQPQPGAGRGGGGRAGGGGGGRGNQPPRTARPDAEYRQLVERWIVPDYKGQPKPHAIWETARGTIELELYPGDAPFGTEQFFKLVESGDIVGTEFSRLVPDFVAQQEGIRNASTLRDEVNQHPLSRGNLAWASAGLDTGRPGYTLNHTPQPHNEGDFTSLGRVVAGQDAVDKLELGDKILAARIKK